MVELYWKQLSHCRNQCLTGQLWKERHRALHMEHTLRTLCYCSGQAGWFKCIVLNVMMDWCLSSQAMQHILHRGSFFLININNLSLAQQADRTGTNISSCFSPACECIVIVCAWQTKSYAIEDGKHGWLFTLTKSCSWLLAKKCWSRLGQSSRRRSNP